MRTFRLRVRVYEIDLNGTLAAEVTSTCGMFDLRERRLLPDPAAVWRTVATDPSVFGL